MSIIGIGIDAVELDRIEKAMSPAFVDRILTSSEQAVFAKLTHKRQLEYLAGRFAAKEAYAKALGTGIGRVVSFQDIEVLNSEAGQPYMKAPQAYQKHISITHTSHDAQAIVILEQ